MDEGAAFKERWRARLASGNRDVAESLTRALVATPEHVKDAVALTRDDIHNVRSGALVALGMVAREHPELVSDFVSGLLERLADDPVQPPHEQGRGLDQKNGPRHFARHFGSREAPQVHEPPTKSAAEAVPDGPDEAARGDEADDADDLPPGVDTAPGVAVPAKDRPADALPHEEPAHRSANVPPLLYATTAEMMGAILSLGWTPELPRADDPYEGWKRLQLEAIEDTLDGLFHLIELVYRRDSHERPWHKEDVFEVLLARALAGIMPVRVTRTAPDAARVELGAPFAAAPDGVDRLTWPQAVTPFVNLLGNFVHPGFKFKMERKPSAADLESRDAVVAFIATVPPTPLAAGGDSGSSRGR